ncbi:drug resistance MFS transporter, drug:H+ antiporter-2 (14 Spanner) (DHA2) family [Chromobacterium violaceum]|uniref:Drug resistance MFS transporter, drug:H+ antiporter-2 (14 Spanner) (DHA2) family n=1 Tax=Chromobacterium violaceum TaxID=536 RepID=A0A447T6R0_CHRVL|nr:drug resistance MFS transporter, drug:H+ antiporter-2 (14 Spanner) (DHA2) family [Chromobacterium violaceum]
MFLAIAPAGAAVFLLALRSLPADAPPAGRIRFDLAGALLLALALTAYALAMTSGRGRFGPMNLALLLAAAAGVAAFVRVEMRVEAPLVRIGLLRDPALAGSLIAGALVAAVMMGTLVIGPFTCPARWGWMWWLRAWPCPSVPRSPRWPACRPAA